MGLGRALRSLDLVETGGGGGGTVTSVAGGEGIPVNVASAVCEGRPEGVTVTSGSGGEVDSAGTGVPQLSSPDAALLRSDEKWDAKLDIAKFG